MDEITRREAIENLLRYCAGKTALDKGRLLGLLLLGRPCLGTDDDWALSQAMRQLLFNALVSSRKKFHITTPVSDQPDIHQQELESIDTKLKDSDLRAWSMLWAYYICGISIEQLMRQGWGKRMVQVILKQAREQQLEQRLATIVPPPQRPPGSVTSPHIFQVPFRPTWLVGREHDLNMLRQRLLRQRPGVQPDSPDAPRRQGLTVMRGWPGVGKTTLAATLAHDSTISAAFPDGVLWAALGPTPNLFAELRRWARGLGIPEAQQGHTITEVSAQLAAHLRHQRCLLIIDDIWDVTHIRPFEIGGDDCALLLTTRLPRVAQAVATPDAIYLLEVLGEDEALELLQTLASAVVADNPQASRELVVTLERLPLALQVAGRLLNTEAAYGFGVEELLDEICEGAKLLEQEAPRDLAMFDAEGVPYLPTVQALLARSTARLDREALRCFVALSVFAAKPATFNAAALQSMWQMDNPKPMIRQMIDRGLLEPVGEEERRYWIHALLVAHAKTFLTA
jgi:hypothetical protein